MNTTDRRRASASLGDFAGPELTVGDRIRNQIGSRALYMMAAYNLVALAGEGQVQGLQFRIRGSKKANSIRIELAADDTYIVSFRKIGSAPSFDCKVIASIDYVHADSLCRIIEANTGLYLSL